MHHRLNSIAGISLAIALVSTPITSLAQTPSISQEDKTHTTSAPLANLVVAGENHACATLTSGEIRCWGDNRYGQLGNGSKDNFSLMSTAVRDISNPNTIIEAGTYHTCLMLNGGLKCFGSNGSGQLGIGSETIESLIPVDVPNMSSGITYFAAGNNHNCAIKDGMVFCWGANTSGAIGNGKINPYVYKPEQAIGISDINSISAGVAHTCATSNNGTAYCWGYNLWGQIGNGVYDSTGYDIYIPTPTKVVGLDSGTLFVAAGGSHSCALMKDGTIKCWGHNGFGQLGGSSDNYTYTQPISVLGINDAISIVLGDWHTCALIKNGTVKCWGRNEEGQLGSNHYNSSSMPLDVPGLTNVVQITAGNNYTCARLSNGRVKCWGDNFHGQLGRGDSYLNGNSLRHEDPQYVLNIGGAQLAMPLVIKN